MRRHGGGMFRKMAMAAATAAGLLVQPVFGGEALAQGKPAALATGPELGAYYPVGVALRLLVEEGKAKDTPLVVQATRGSVENLKGLREGRFDLAIVQADQALDAYRGTGAFGEGGAFTDLRLVMALHEEALVLVARKDAGIAKLADLKGKTVDLGPVGAGWRPLAQRIVATMGWPAELKSVDVPSGQSVAALCDKRVDAAFFFIGHPSAQLVDALSRCPTRLVPINGKIARTLDEEIPPIERTTLPGGAYATQRKPLPTLGVRAVLVARADTPDALVNELLTTVQANRSLFRTLHPALHALGEGSLKPDAGAVPLHPAAARFFDAQGK